MWKVKQKKRWKIFNFEQLQGNCKRARLQFCNQVIDVLKLSMIVVNKEKEKKFNFRYVAAAHDKKTGLPKRLRKSLEQGKSKVFMLFGKIRMDRNIAFSIQTGKYDAAPT